MTGIDRNGIHQYLTFKLADEMYAINVANIKEVLTVPKLTKVPKMPPFMSGIINLRGNVVPVLDLCKKFGLGETTMTEDTAIIVSEVDTENDDGTKEELIIGVFSDEVQKVVTIENEEIEPPPKIGVSIDTAFISGMGHIDNRFIIILDINKVLNGKDIETIQEKATEVLPE
jgi:purine-binding chemotaxis protein CheW